MNDFAAELARAEAAASARIIMPGSVRELIHPEGRYVLTCRRPDGSVRWKDTIENTVMTLGKNQGLDNWLAGSAWTATGPFMGLISSVSYSAISAADTSASHSGWTEAGSTNAPTFAARLTTNGGWSAASAAVKALASALAFSITGSGTLEGAFLVGGSGAVATLMSTAGTLISAGLFTGGTRAVLNLDTVDVSFSMGM
jgi:hypothetical protein